MDKYAKQLKVVAFGLLILLALELTHPGKAHPAQTWESSMGTVSLGGVESAHSLEVTSNPVPPQPPTGVSIIAS